LLRLRKSEADGLEVDLAADSTSEPQYAGAEQKE
jgi:hypothetical protein